MQSNITHGTDNQRAIDRLDKAQALLLTMCGPDGVNSLDASYIVNLVELACELIVDARASVN
jgi:hypothetical protein